MKNQVDIKSLKKRLLDTWRGAVMKLFAWFHCALIASILFATVFFLLHIEEVSEEFNFQVATTATQAFVRGLLIFIPVGISYYAEKKIPPLWAYILAALAISIFGGFLIGHVGGGLFVGVVCFFRAHNRIIDEHTRSVFDAPHYFGLLVFLLVFLLSAARNDVELQRLSVIGAACYFMLCVAFNGVERLDEFLVLNRGMHALPVRRIQRIAGGAVLAAVVIAGVFLLPAVFGYAGDFTIDTSKAHSSANFNQDFADLDGGGGGMQSPGVGLEELFGDSPQLYIPPFVSYIFYGAIGVGIAALIAYGIYKLVIEFRRTFSDNNNDVIQFLGKTNIEEAEEHAGEIWRRPKLLDRSPNAVVRRMYRKQIMKAASETPKKWQSPAEIEEFAGVTAPKLHTVYEKARYGFETCTQEDVKALRDEVKSR